MLAKDEASQRNYLTDLYTLLMANISGLRLQRVAWYSWKDPSPTRATCNFCYGSGLFRRDDSPKPAWDAYVNLPATTLAWDCPLSLPRRGLAQRGLLAAAVLQ